MFNILNKPVFKDKIELGVMSYVRVWKRIFVKQEENLEISILFFLKF